MDREAERAAFAKASAYLNYKRAAKWSAHAAAAGTGIVYVALLVVLWLFTDLMVYRGRLPTYHSLTPLQQLRFFNEWNSRPEVERKQLLLNAGLSDVRSQHLAAESAGLGLSREDLRALWRAQVGHIVATRLGADAFEGEGPNQVDYEADLGIASLVVRQHTEGRLVTPVAAFMARRGPVDAQRRHGRAPHPPALSRRSAARRQHPGFARGGADAVDA